MVTAFEILAKTFSRLGDFQVQAFPAFGVERTGAPIQAFLRVAQKEILNRSNIYHPHLIVVFDESLIDMVPVFNGLKEEGAVLINTEKPREAFDYLGRTVYTIPATRISLEYGLGSRSLPIINAAMIGAIGYLFEADPETLLETVRENVPVKSEANGKSAEKAYHSVIGDSFPNSYLLDRLHSPTEEEAVRFEMVEEKEPEGIDAPYWDEPLSKSKTGNWRVVTPKYVDRRPPCNHTCPAGTDVRAFVRLTAEKKFEEAIEKLYEHNPFPGVCGRVCPHFCEQNCNRNEFDEGLNIGAIERFLGDKAMDINVSRVPVTKDEKIAVIGSGPAGLTAALRLCERGYDVTVFEAMPTPGGMMRSGIPKFRLPDEVLDLEIRRIEQKGVKIFLNQRVKVNDLAKSYDAVISAVGSHVGVSLGLKDEEMLTLDGIEFLREFKINGDHAGIRKNDKIAIVGGGNTAIDVARTSLRLGAEPVIFYRRTIREMPAIAQEVEEALHEGVQMKFLKAPIDIHKDESGQLQLTLIDMELGEPDASGRRRPVAVKGSEKILMFNQVIKAIGQRSDDFAFDGKPFQAKQGRIEWEGDVPVFCAGDMAWGGTVTEAIGSGNKAADEVAAFLELKEYIPEDMVRDVVTPRDINFDYFLPTPRHKESVMEPSDLYENFEELSTGLQEHEVLAESSRCLHCGDCFSCGNCFNYCPDAAILVDDQGRIRIDYDYCKGCGICAEECPCSAIEFGLAEAVG